MAYPAQNPSEEIKKSATSVASITAIISILFMLLNTFNMIVLLVYNPYPYTHPDFNYWIFSPQQYAICTVSMAFQLIILPFSFISAYFIWRKKHLRLAISGAFLMFASAFAENYFYLSIPEPRNNGVPEWQLWQTMPCYTVFVFILSIMTIFFMIVARKQFAKK
jgi:hypothetical protein